ncbi:MAG: 1-deoxy-D-xylulose-5-phosphate reductoisomerase, partial [Candidatus Cloacimonadaceae bacterium]|nr:1-deoxy-D-xylulose-5-phosphate reductoisomerase [Candidatus Cloacimonadaceae bacterium]
MKKTLVLLGATGSIGTSTLQVIREQKDRFTILLATAHRDYARLMQIATEFNIPYLVLTGDFGREERQQLQSELSGCKLFFGEDELLALLDELEYDIALNAITGSAGLRSTMCVAFRGIDLALANKESLVMAGHLVMPVCETSGSRILPVDSEHSAVFQALGSHSCEQVQKIHLTASGGPFLRLPLEDFANISREAALRHPNWSMGTKVTLDSATMFNKALEVIEAHWLFGADYEKINAVIHPQSIIHSMVEFIDGSFLAQLSTPDMQLPILYALSYPQRLGSQLVTTNLLQISPLTFLAIEPERYPLFFLGVECGKAGGIMPTVMNSANEAALELFLQGKIQFTEIFETVRKAVESQQN